MKRSELAVECFFPQSYGTFKQRYITETIDFLDMAYGTKKNIFDNLIDSREELARSGPTLSGSALTLFDGLFFSQFKIYRLNFVPTWFPTLKLSYQIFNKQIFVNFGIIAFLVEPVYAIIHTFLRITHEPLRIL